jgi:hypothetical protein
MTDCMYREPRAFTIIPFHRSAFCFCVSFFPPSFPDQITVRHNTGNVSRLTALHVALRFANVLFRPRATRDSATATTAARGSLVELGFWSCWSALRGLAGGLTSRSLPFAD